MTGGEIRLCILFATELPWQVVAQQVVVVRPPFVFSSLLLAEAPADSTLPSLIYQHTMRQAFNVRAFTEGFTLGCSSPSVLTTASG